MNSLKIRFLFIFTFIFVSLFLLLWNDNRLLLQVEKDNNKILDIKKTHLNLLKMRQTEKNFFLRKDIKYYNSLLQLSNEKKEVFTELGLSDDFQRYTASDIYLYLISKPQLFHYQYLTILLNDKRRMVEPKIYFL